VLGVMGIGLAEVLWFFGAGLALPASKMGELSIELPGDKSALHAWEALISAYQEHVRQRDDYKHAPTAHKQLELRNSVYALRKEILHFLHAHPHDPHKSDVEAMFQKVDEWYNQYSYSTFPTAPVPPPSPAPPASPHKPLAKEPVPPTIAKPPTLEWLEGERIRHMIQFHKEWLRKWKKKRKEAEPWEDWYKKEVDKAIARETEEIEKLREKAKALGQSTGEEWDEPLEGPPPPPLDPLTKTYIQPVNEYINKKTGEKRVFTDAEPPTSEDWVRVEFNPTTGQYNIRWGWVPQDDPETGKRTWIPGWILIN
jgi:hypothetical protein